MKYKQKSDGTEVEATQWQPGVEHWAVVREHPASRGWPGGSALVAIYTGTTTIGPGWWIVDDHGRMTVHAPEDFEAEYELAEDPTPPTLFCPLASAGCRRGGCAWWCDEAEACGVVVLMALAARTREDANARSEDWLAK